MRIKTICLAVCLTSLVGCATITKDANQLVKIESYNKNDEKIDGAKCTLKNERGEWHGEAPGAILVHRSNENLEIKCDKDGEESAFATLVSRLNGNMFGNILFGGGIGAIVDHSNGKAYDYPGWSK